MTPSLQDRIYEVHPEVTFATLNDEHALTDGKKSPSGRKQRRALLERVWGRDVARLLDAPHDPRYGHDDLLDAIAACWTARQILQGKALLSLPEHPPIDSRGLRMEIMT